MIAVETILCAWCPMDEPQEGQSHGICEMHLNLALLELEERRKKKEQKYEEILGEFHVVPSYVGQRKAFEEYKAKIVLS